mmetsp:Transcript_102439/g.325518  ORF Transcript_102439/g.325518 Transcript_102439/m.325518 type:complete len:226 (+) Transcript_102439:253-930(+)
MGLDLRCLCSSSCSCSSCFAAARQATSSYDVARGLTDWPSCAGTTAGAELIFSPTPLGVETGLGCGSRRTVESTLLSRSSSASVFSDQMSKTAESWAFGALLASSCRSARAILPSSEAERPMFGPFGGKSFARAISRRVRADKPWPEPAVSMVKSSWMLSLSFLLVPFFFNLLTSLLSSSVSSTSSMSSFRHAALRGFFPTFGAAFFFPFAMAGTTWLARPVCLS